jgi:hypothetical protein
MGCFLLSLLSHLQGKEFLKGVDVEDLNETGMNQEVDKLRPLHNKALQPFWNNFIKPYVRKAFSASLTIEDSSTLVYKLPFYFSKDG